jgi:spermidine/putrescine transport system ATP-binding protein
VKGSQVTIDHVSKRFGDFVALDDINFTIKPGEFFSLLGPSGCGKTTLLRIIAGFESPDDGVVLFDDKNVIPLPPDKRESNTVFQTYALFPHMTVYENVAFSLRLKKLPKDEIDKKVREYVHLVQLDQHINKKPNQLSGGQKQRVAIARALVNHPVLLLCDEPTGSLDSRTAAEILELLEKENRSGTTIFLVTHDTSISFDNAKVIEISDGQIV